MPRRKKKRRMGRNGGDEDDEWAAIAENRGFNIQLSILININIAAPG